MGRDCLPSVPKPRKRRPEGENDGQFAGTSSFDPSSDASSAAAQNANTAPSSSPRKPTSSSTLGTLPVTSLLSRNDIHHTSSRSFAALLSQGLKIEPLTAVSPVQVLPTRLMLTNISRTLPNCSMVLMRMPWQALAPYSVTTRHTSLLLAYLFVLMRYRWRSQGH